MVPLSLEVDKILVENFVFVIPKLFGYKFKVWIVKSRFILLPNADVSRSIPLKRTHIFMSLEIITPSKDFFRKVLSSLKLYHLKCSLENNGYIKQMIQGMEDTCFKSHLIQELTNFHFSGASLRYDNVISV